jgi:tetratricopeptide (TPR) repeat protein
MSTSAAFLPDVVKELSGALLSVEGMTVAATDQLSAAALVERVQLVWELRQRAEYSRLGALLGQLLVDLAATRADTSSSEHDAVVRLQVHAYNAASSVLKKLGDYGVALVAADRAVQTARALDEPVLVAAAAYRLANVLLPAGRLDETTAIALEAANRIEPGKAQTPRSYAMWGGLLLSAAVALARRGDESQAWELMGEARTAARLLGAEHADLYVIFGPLNVAVHAVQVAVELRNGRDAVRRAARVDVAHLPATLLERRAQFLIDVATGHVLEQADEAAVGHLLLAETVAVEEVRYSAAAHQLVYAMLRRERVGAVPELRPLAGRLGVQ